MGQDYITWELYLNPVIRVSVCEEIRLKLDRKNKRRINNRVT